MTDELERLFPGIDRARPVPASVRRAIAAELVGASVADEVAGLDAPRPLPPVVRQRIETALLGDVGVRPLPARLKGRLHRAVLVAAALVALVGAVGLTTRDNAASPTARRSNNAVGNQSASGGNSATDGGLAAGESVEPRSGTAAGGATSGGGAANSARTPSGHAPVRVRLVGGGDGAAGFRAYVDELNGGGAAAQHLTFTTDSSAAVTVNVSGAPIDAPATSVLMESLAAREADLRGNVFAAASVVERQARIAANAAFPAASDGRAVIVAGDEEPFASRVPQAIEAVLQARGVSTLRIPYESGVPAVFPRVDAAFVSLPTGAAGAWLREAKERAYAPAKGIWGVYSLADDDLVPVMPSPVRVVSPFTFVDSGEAATLRAATKRPLSAELIHGWVSAKLLATALARTSDLSATGISNALAALSGFEDGFAAPLEFRPNTHSRTPEGVVLRPTGGRLVAAGGFVRDAP